MCNAKTSLVSRISLALVLFVNLSAIPALAGIPKKGAALAKTDDAFVVTADLPTDVQVGRVFGFSIKTNLSEDAPVQCELGEGAPDKVEPNGDCSFIGQPTEVGTINIPVKVTSENKVVTKTFTVKVAPWAFTARDFEDIRDEVARLQGTYQKDDRTVRSDVTLSKVNLAIQNIKGDLRPNTIELTRAQLLQLVKHFRWLCYGLLFSFLVVFVYIIDLRRRLLGISWIRALVPVLIICLMIPALHAATPTVASITPSSLKAGESGLVKVCGSGLDTANDAKFEGLKHSKLEADKGCLEFTFDATATAAKGDYKLMIQATAAGSFEDSGKTLKVRDTAPSAPIAPTTDFSARIAAREDMRWLALFNAVCGTEPAKARCGKEFGPAITGTELFGQLKKARNQAEENAVMAKLANAAEFNAADRTLGDPRLKAAIAGGIEAGIQSLPQATSADLAPLTARIQRVEMKADAAMDATGALAGTVAELGHVSVLAGGRSGFLGLGKPKLEQLAPKAALTAEFIRGCVKQLQKDGSLGAGCEAVFPNHVAAAPATSGRAPMQPGNQ